MKNRYEYNNPETCAGIPFYDFLLATESHVYVVGWGALEAGGRRLESISGLDFPQVTGPVPDSGPGPRLTCIKDTDVTQPR